MTVAWSYSRLENFELCPKWFHAVFVAKTHREEKHPSAAHGQEVHEAFRKAVVEKAPLPPQLARFNRIVQLFSAFPGEQLTEFQMAVNAELRPTDWFARDVYCRAIADFAAVGQRDALLVDYKTGRPKNEFTQLELTACLLMSHRPEIQAVKLRFLYTTDASLIRPPDTDPLKREDIPWVLSKLEPRVRAYQEAHEKEEFPAKPSWKCRQCPVNKCPYWEGRR